MAAAPGYSRVTAPLYLPWDLHFALEGDGPLELNVEYDIATRVLQTSLTNRSDSAVTASDITMRAATEQALAGGWAHLHGRSMGDDALVVRFDGPAADGYSGQYLTANGYVSREILALTLPVRSTPALVLGSLRSDRYFTDVQIEVAEDERLVGVSLRLQLEGTPIAAGESLALPAMFFAEGHDAYGLLEEYAELVAVEMGARVADEVPSGWCSWYFYGNQVSEADIRGNLEAIQGAGYPVDYLQIDDGYQSCTGDWLVPNERFPSGMAALATEITEAGYRPGLWLAPFVMHRDSAVLREHPEFALRHRDGSQLELETWLGPVAVVDCTHPGAEQWLRTVLRTVVREWGYTFLKLDALVYAAQEGDAVSYHVDGTTGPANLRVGLEIIRDEAGGQVFLLGCTCPFGPAIGLVDGMRVGPDVRTTWMDGTRPSVRHAMRMTLQRNWMHRRWWLNDPDCLVLRAEETDLDEAEVRFLAAGVAFSGGLAVSSDNLMALDDERSALTRTLMPATGMAAKPADSSEGPVGSAWRARLDETRSLVGVLNWGEESRWVSVYEYLFPGEVAFNPWTGQILGKGDLFLRPHEGTVWQVTARSPGPRVVGDTGHLGYDGLTMRQVSGRLQLRNDRRQGRTVAVEARGHLRTYALEPGEMRWFD